MSSTSSQAIKRQNNNIHKFSNAYQYIYQNHKKLTFNGFPVDETPPIFSADNVLSPKILEALLKKLYNEDGPSAQLKRNIRKDNWARADILIYSNDYFSGFNGAMEVVFNDSCQIQYMSPPDEFSAQEIEDVVRNAVSYFGQKYKIVGEAKFFCNLLEYRFNSSIPDGEWHSDRCTEDTMVIMLTDPDDPQKGWNGGNLQFSLETGRPSYNREVEYQLKYTQNRAIFFNNFGVKHRFTAMEPKDSSKTSTRAIFTLFRVDQKTTFTDIRNRSRSEDRILDNLINLSAKEPSVCHVI